MSRQAVSPGDPFTPETSGLYRIITGFVRARIPAKSPCAAPRNERSIESRRTITEIDSTNTVMIALDGRINALARAHALIVRNFGQEGEVIRGATLEGLVGTILEPHETTSIHGQEHLRVNGPHVSLSRSASAPL